MIEQQIIQRLWSIYNNPTLENFYYENKQEERKDIIIKIGQLKQIIKKSQCATV